MNWQQANRDYLMAALARVKGRMQQANGRQSVDLAALDAAVSAAEARLPSPAALQQICRTFALSDFERDLLLLCAAVDLDGDFVDLFAALQGSAERAVPTFGLALAVLDGAHWTAILPDAPLRRWHFINLAAQESVTRAALHIDERVLHHLAGTTYLDERLAGLLHPIEANADLAPSQQRLVDQIGNILAREERAVPIVALAGGDARTTAAVAAQVCAGLGLSLYLLRHEDLPVAVADRHLFARLWEREALLRGSSLLIDLDESSAVNTVQSLVDDMAWPVFIAGRMPVVLNTHRPLLRFSVEKPAAEEQAVLWERSTGGARRFAQRIRAPIGGPVQPTRRHDRRRMQRGIGSARHRSRCH